MKEYWYIVKEKLLIGEDGHKRDCSLVFVTSVIHDAASEATKLAEHADGEQYYVYHIDDGGRVDLSCVANYTDTIFATLNWGRGDHYHHARCHLLAAATILRFERGGIEDEDTAVVREESTQCRPTVT